MVLLDSDRPIVIDLCDRILRPLSDLDGDGGIDLADHVLNGLMERAKTGAATLMEQAVTEADAMRRQASEEGYREGLKRAEAEREAMIRNLAVRNNEEKAAMQADFDRRIDELEPEILELSLAIAEKILHIELTRNDRAFSSLVKYALSRLKAGERGTIRIGRDDYFRSVQADADLLSEAQDNFEFSVDDSLPDGGCRIESTSGNIDAGMDVQLASVARALRGDDE